jgi:hypothetical protein
VTPDLDAAIAPVADAFDELGVSYYLAGSVVSSLHGVARATADVDVVAALPGRHAAALVARLGDDYYADVDTIRDALAHRAMFTVIHQPTMLKVDVYACTSEFDQSVLARRTADTLLAEPRARRFWIAPLRISCFTSCIGSTRAATSPIASGATSSESCGSSARLTAPSSVAGPSASAWATCWNAR